MMDDDDTSETTKPGDAIAARGATESDGARPLVSETPDSVNTTKEADTAMAAIPSPQDLSPSPRALSPGARISAAHLISLAAILGLIVVSTLLWFEWRKRFPLLDGGAYVGIIRGAVHSPNTEFVRMYVESDPISHELLISLFRPGWKPQRIPLVTTGNMIQGAKAALPIVLEGPDGKFKLLGERADVGEYHGSIINLLTTEEGEWDLFPITDTQAPGSPDASGARSVSEGAQQEVELWLRLKSELTAVEDQIAASQALVPGQRAELEKLTGLMKQSDSFRTRADNKFKLVQSELRQARQTLLAKQEEAKMLQQRFDVSQNVVGMGRLVSLARESLERENRWADSMIRSSSGEVSDDLVEAVARAQKITSLKRSIEQERNKMGAVLDPASSAPPDGEKAPNAEVIQ